MYDIGGPGASIGRKKNRKFHWLKISGTVLLSSILLLMMTLFFFRSDLLTWAIKKVQVKIQNEYHCNLKIENFSFTGLSSIQLQGISLKPYEDDTLVSVHKIATTIKILPLLLGKIRMASLEIEGGKVTLVRLDSNQSNFKSFLNKKTINDSNESNSKRENFAESGYKIINRLMAQIPAEFQVQNCSIGLKNIDKDYTILFSKVILVNEKLDALWGFNMPTDTQEWVATGTFSTVDMNADVKMHASNNSKMYLPVVDEKYNLTFGADELELKLNEVDYSDDELQIECFASCKNLLINHKRLADHDVKVASSSGKLRLVVGENFIAIDSSSSVSINKIMVSPYFRYQKNPFKEFTLKVSTQKLLAQDFFNSLPDGMFESLNGIQSEGFLSYHMHCELNDTCPRDVVFESELIPENFKVISWGNARLPKLNSSFLYTPYEYGRPQRSFELGESNPDFTPIEDISDYVKNAVLSSEDPSFFYHKGFVMEAIRGSIAQNYISKRFARGASTISMQLVKNVFLSRQKTMSRKFEEMLVVWMIENLHIASKKRMFEVYLNMIEWGPSIYGIGQASHFYFSKSPSEITLPEAIYLSAIIPRPKGFMWNFNDSSAALKPHMERYIKNLSRIMAGRKLVNEEDTAMMNTNVFLTGPAKKFLKKYKVNPDTTDSEVIPADEWDMVVPSELELK